MIFAGNRREVLRASKRFARRWCLVFALAFAAMLQATAYAQSSGPDGTPATPRDTRLWLPTQGPIYFQIGAFGSEDNADRLAGRLDELESQVIMNTSGNRTIYRVIVGPFANSEKAQEVVSRSHRLDLGDPQVLSSLPSGAASPPKRDAETGPSRIIDDDESTPVKLPETIRGAPPPLIDKDASADDPMPLRLMVTINSEPTYLIGAFFLFSDSQIGATRGELLELGIDVSSVGSDDIIRLDDIEEIEYDYDSAQQSISFMLPAAWLTPTILNAKSKLEFIEPDRTMGAYLNYTGFLSASYQDDQGGGSVDLGSINLDGHLFGRFGIFSQSGIVGTSSSTSEKFVRLNSTWSYADPSTARVYRAGDLIAGGVAWSRPVRMGGFQIQRNFSLRPDLITLPLPSVSGSAAVPSTLDVYVGNLRTYSTDIPAGPYRIDNLPVVSGSGTARVVVTDVTGRQIETETSFFSDARLLRAGFFDYSAEVGFMRTQFGRGTGNYNEKPVFSAGARYGLNDNITLEGHGELGRGLALVGGGANFTAGPLGLMSVAGAFSNGNNRSGTLLYGSWYLPLGKFNLQANSRRTFGDYFDLAALSITDRGFGFTGSGISRAVDQLNVSYRFEKIRSSLSIGAIHSDFGDGDRTGLLNASFTSGFTSGMSFYVSAVYDVEARRASSAFFGLTVPFGHSVSAFSGVTSDERGTSFSAEIQKSIDSEPGSFGGRLSVSQGEQSFGTAYGAVRLNTGLLEASLSQRGDRTHALTTFAGSLVAAGGGLYAAPQITDAFAVVKAGAPGVEVSLENRPMGTTRNDGTMLLTGLNSFQGNLVSINPKNFPINADIPIASMQVVPAQRSGVVAEFAVQVSNPSAVVIFMDSGGELIEAGAQGEFSGVGERFFVGYDGRAFIKNLQSVNNVTIKMPTGECSASFDYVEDVDTQVTIGPVICE